MLYAIQNIAQLPKQFNTIALYDCLILAHFVQRTGSLRLIDGDVAKPI